jgi:hypothetical protein
MALDPALGRALDRALGYRRKRARATATPTASSNQIPRGFWKITAWVTHDDSGVSALRSTGFVLDRDLLVAADQFEPARAALPFERCTPLSRNSGIDQVAMTQSAAIQPAWSARSADAPMRQYEKELSALLSAVPSSTFRRSRHSLAIIQPSVILRTV